MEIRKGYYAWGVYSIIWAILLDSHPIFAFIFAITAAVSIFY